MPTVKGSGDSITNSAMADVSGVDGTVSDGLHSAGIQQGGGGEPHVEKLVATLAEGCSVCGVPVMRNSCDRGDTSHISRRSYERQSQPRIHKLGHENSAPHAAPYVSGEYGSGPQGQVAKPVVARRCVGVERNRMRLRIASKKLVKNCGDVAGGSDLVLSPRENGTTETSRNSADAPRLGERKSEMVEMRGDSDDMCAPVSAGLCTLKRTSPVNESDNRSNASRYQPPSVEERLRLIKEERAERLDKMQQQYVSAMADTVAPRPKILTRIRCGALKAIAGHPGRGNKGEGMTLAIEDHLDSQLRVPCDVGSGGSRPPAQRENISRSSSEEDVAHRQKLQQWKRE